MTTTSPDVIHTTLMSTTAPVAKVWDVPDSQLPDLMTRRQTAEVLRERGFTMKVQTMARLCLLGIGPASAGRWGQTETYRPLPTLEWARNRVAATATERREPASAA